MVLPVVSDFSVEHARDALGIGWREPRLSWEVRADPGWVQQAFRFSITDAEGSRTTPWFSGADSRLRPWPTSPLASRDRVRLRVQVKGSDGAVSKWSDEVAVEAGLLDAADWRAVAVSPSREVSVPSQRQFLGRGPTALDYGEGIELTGAEAQPMRRPWRLRRTFDLAVRPESARLYVTAHGLFEMEINGHRVGREALGPGWTVYGERLRYCVYDVTEYLQAGENVVVAWLADGWYRGRLGFLGGHVDLYGSQLALIAQLEVRDTNGGRTIVATDDRWEAQLSPIVASGLYEGERFDARLADETWEPVVTGPIRAEILEAPEGPPVRCTRELPVQRVITTPSGKTILDFGQNFSGRVRIAPFGPTGTTFVLRHAEVLQDGELHTEALREADATDIYIRDCPGICVTGLIR